ELRARMQQHDDRLEALRELCIRGHAPSLELVTRALYSLEPEELASGVAGVLFFGEAAGDGMIAALQAPEPALRQLAALALGRLKLRRAVLPLLKQLDTETSEIHPELARALGEFGPAAVRPLTHAIAAGGPFERFIAALAHAANRGAAKEVERLENDADPTVAQAARKAMARRSRLEWEDLAVREQRSLGESNGPAQLSQAFYAELAKVAI
ncbi:MAG: HEAT repeat domain-containing protein, partial [Polyangiales bacterium]